MAKRFEIPGLPDPLGLAEKAQEKLLSGFPVRLVDPLRWAGRVGLIDDLHVGIMPPSVAVTKRLRQERQP